MRPLSVLQGHSVTARSSRVRERAPSMKAIDDKRRGAREERAAAPTQWRGICFEGSGWAWRAAFRARPPPDQKPVQLNIGGGFPGVYGAASDRIGNGGNFTLGVIFNTSPTVSLQGE